MTRAVLARAGSAKALAVALDKPLFVALDGTLIKSNALLELALVLLRSRPRMLIAVSIALFQGKARFTRKLAPAAAALDPVALPYREQLVELLRAEQLRGRRIVLTTDADRTVANTIAEYVGCFDEVLSNDDLGDLSGSRKRDLIVRSVGVGGYIYAGNSRADLPVWRDAAAAVVVCDRKDLHREISTANVPIVQAYEAPISKAALVLRAMRIHQWAKNLLVFAPIVLGHRFRAMTAWGSATAMFIALSFCASALYLTNDLFDIHADRRHPSKSRRPFASGELTPLAALVGIPLLLAIALVFVYPLPRMALWCVVAYVGGAVTYSWFLKQLFLADVFVLAGLYTMRVLAGGAATGIAISAWTLSFSMFILLSLAILKRVSELRAYCDGAKLPGRAYYTTDIAQLSSLGSASGLMAVLVLALYLRSPDVLMQYRRPSLLWLMCPLVAYWISRMWVFANRGAISDDPFTFALRDPVTYSTGMLAIILILISM